MRIIALLLVGQFSFGWLLEGIARNTPERGYFVNLHKSTGVLIGLLILLRIGWRLGHRAPPLPLSMPQWQRRAAHASHLAMYLCMLLVPLSGYLASNFSKHGIKFFVLCSCKKSICAKRSYHKHVALFGIFNSRLNNFFFFPAN